MEFATRRGRTILFRRRFTHPLQALDPFYAQDGSLCLMMLNVSGGMVGGDRLSSRITLGENSAAVLTTASASKVYRTLGPAVRQETLIRLGPHATIEFLPDHVIPHPGAVYDQCLRVKMDTGSRAIICDAIAAGRVGRGEAWRFREIRSETIVLRDSRPLYINRFKILPSESSPQQLGFTERYNYLATMLVLDERRSGWSEVIAQTDDLLNSNSATRGGASELAGGGCAVRLLAESATDLRLALNRVWEVMRQRLLGRHAFDMRRP